MSRPVGLTLLLTPLLWILLTAPSLATAASSARFPESYRHLNDMDLAGLLQGWDGSFWGFVPRPSYGVMATETVPPKRRLSVNNDLASLADMLHEGAVRRKTENAHSLLQKIGKKRASLNIDGANMDRLSSGYYGGDVLPPREVRGSQLSVDLPLDTLTDMIQDKRRKMLHSRLMAIGKRSSRQDTEGRGSDAL